MRDRKGRQGLHCFSSGSPACLLRDCGSSLPASYQPDGISQVATLKGKGTARRKKPLFWKAVAPWPARKSKPDHWVSYAVVSENWKLVTNGDAKHAELDDLIADRWRRPISKRNIRARQTNSGRCWPNGRALCRPSPQGRCFQIYETQRRQDEGALSGVSQIGIKKTQKNDSLSLLIWADRGNLFQRSSKGRHSR